MGQTLTVVIEKRENDGSDYWTVKNTESGFKYIVTLNEKLAKACFDSILEKGYICLDNY